MLLSCLRWAGRLRRRQCLGPAPAQSGPAGSAGGVVRSLRLRTSPARCHALTGRLRWICHSVCKCR